ncbi:hypothetical protein C8R44DRAFT_869906 [Mycena epipterygia]|nr:hypothetical protein C8R44DRAFT_869906 [Mycena epipterygia]
MSPYFARRRGHGTTLSDWGQSSPPFIMVARLRMFNVWSKAPLRMSNSPRKVAEARESIREPLLHLAELAGPKYLELAHEAFRADAFLGVEREAPIFDFHTGLSCLFSATTGQPNSLAEAVELCCIYGAVADRVSHLALGAQKPRNIGFLVLKEPVSDRILKMTLGSTPGTWNRFADGGWPVGRCVEWLTLQRMVSPQLWTPLLFSKPPPKPSLPHSKKLSRGVGAVTVDPNLKWEGLELHSAVLSLPNLIIAHKQDPQLLEKFRILSNSAIIQSLVDMKIAVLACNTCVDVGQKNSPSDCTWRDLFAFPSIPATKAG